MERQTRRSPSSAIHQASASRRTCWTSGSSKRSAAVGGPRADVHVGAPTGAPARRAGRPGTSARAAIAARVQRDAVEAQRCRSGRQVSLIARSPRAPRARSPAGPGADPPPSGGRVPVAVVARVDRQVGMQREGVGRYGSCTVSVSSSSSELVDVDACRVGQEGEAGAEAGAERRLHLGRVDAHDDHPRVGDLQLVLQRDHLAQVALLLGAPPREKSSTSGLPAASSESRRRRPVWSGRSRSGKGCPGRCIVRPVLPHRDVERTGPGRFVRTS